MSRYNRTSCSTGSVTQRTILSQVAEISQLPAVHWIGGVTPQQFRAGHSPVSVKQELQHKLQGDNIKDFLTPAHYHKQLTHPFGSTVYNLALIIVLFICWVCRVPLDWLWPCQRSQSSSTASPKSYAERFDGCSQISIGACWPGTEATAASTAISWG